MESGVHPLVRESVEFHRRALEAELTFARKRLKAFEAKHGFDSSEFERRFETGELGDDREWFDWEAELTTARALEDKLAGLRGLP